jgi:hypothetical protein
MGWIVLCLEGKRGEEICADYAVRSRVSFTQCRNGNKGGRKNTGRDPEFHDEEVLKLVKSEQRLGCARLEFMHNHRYKLSRFK